MRALNFVVLTLSLFVFLKQLTEDIMLTTQFVTHSSLLTDPQKSLSYFFLYSLSPCSSLWAGVFICWLHLHKCKTILSVPVLWPA